MGAVVLRRQRPCVAALEEVVSSHVRDHRAVEGPKRQLVHRGPDGGGIERRGGVGLAMRRLSIIELAGGRQPITNEDGTVRVVFNHVAESMAKTHGREPGALRGTLIEPVVRSLAPRPQKNGVLNKAKRFLEGLEHPAELGHARWRLFRGDRQLAALFTKREHFTGLANHSHTHAALVAFQAWQDMGLRAEPRHALAG